MIRSYIWSVEKFSIKWELCDNRNFIRRRVLFPGEFFDTKTLMGFNREGLNKLSPSQYKIFLERKVRMEEILLGKTPIIVTTCKSSGNKRLDSIKFKKVIIDEASQSQEIETMLTIRDAEQVVLIGDHKQLGPIFKCDVH